MKSYITKTSVLLALIGCSFVNGATLKSGSAGFLSEPKQLA